MRLRQPGGEGSVQAGMKPPVVNLEEQIGKTVGRIPEGAADYARLTATADALMPRLPFPKGVYRFRSFEEADAWTEQHILRAARKKSQEPRG